MINLPIYQLISSTRLKREREKEGDKLTNIPVDIVYKIKERKMVINLPIYQLISSTRLKRERW